MQSLASMIPSRELKEPYFLTVSHSDQIRYISSYTCLYRNNTDSLHQVSHPNIISEFGCIKVVLSLVLGYWVFCLCVCFFRETEDVTQVKAGATIPFC